MKTSLKLAYLSWKNMVDTAGIGTYLSRVTLLPLMNILLLSTLFTTAKGMNLTMSQLSYQYIYFVPLFSLSAAVSSWEIELINNLGEEYLLHSENIILTRCLQIFAECFFTLVFFTSLLIAAKANLNHILTLFFLFLCFSYIGIILGFGLGFRHEKAINNFLYSITWVLGFGPGPFFSGKVSGIQYLFPGSFALENHFFYENGRLIAYVILFSSFVVYLKKPRRAPLFYR